MPEMIPDFPQQFKDTFHASEIRLSRSTNGLPQRTMTEHKYGAAEHTGSLRKELLSEIPSDTEGIDEDTIKDFFSIMGLRVSDYLVFNPSETPKYNSIVGAYGWSTFPEPNDDGKHFGVTLGGLNMAVVERDRIMEEIHGPIFSEAMLVHELAHASSMWNEWSIVQQDGNRYYSARRIGLGVVGSRFFGNVAQDRNNYLEEGLVAMITSEYLRFKGASLDYKTYADEAGSGVRLLVDRIPDLYDAFIASRSTVEGLRQVPRLINSVDPKLYAKLSKLPYTEAGFIIGTQLIQDALDIADLELVR